MNSVEFSYGSAIAIRLFVRSLKIINIASIVLMALFLAVYVFDLRRKCSKSYYAETKEKYLLDFATSVIKILLATWVWVMNYSVSWLLPSGTSNVFGKFILGLWIVLLIMSLILDACRLIDFQRQERKDKQLEES